MPLNRIPSQPPWDGNPFWDCGTPTTGRQPERHRKIHAPTDAEDRSILYGTVFGWTAGLLRLRQGRVEPIKANRYRETAFDPFRTSAQRMLRPSGPSSMHNYRALAVSQFQAILYDRFRYFARDDKSP
jgi:hypothetical protein